MRNETVINHLANATLQIRQDNFGSFAECLGQAMPVEMNQDYACFIVCLKGGIVAPLFVEVVERGYGEKLLEWFKERPNGETTSRDIAYAPVFVGLQAYVKGERFLRDHNPEVRVTGKEIYGMLGGAGGGSPTVPVDRDVKSSKTRQKKPVLGS